MSRQRRQMRSVPSEFQVRQEDEECYIEGYFAVFNTVYTLWEGATESVAAGAFVNSLSADIRALVNHDTTLVLGRNRAGTLELREDSRGLWGTIKINQADMDAMNLYQRVKRGDVDQCSFGFDILSEKTETGDGGTIHWTIEEVSLHEVSVVTFPAYEETGVSARKAEFKQIEQRQNQQWRHTMKLRLKGEK